MKTFIFTFIISIFFAINICSAQKPKESVMLCNLPGKKIASQDVKMPVDSLSNQISIAEIKQFLESACDKIIYTSAKGTELKISNIMFAYTYKVNGASGFEKAKGDRLTKAMKEKLQNAAPGDKIMIAVDVKPDKSYPNAHKTKALVLYKVVE